MGKGRAVSVCRFSSPDLAQRAVRIKHKCVSIYGLRSFLVRDQRLPIFAINSIFVLATWADHEKVTRIQRSFLMNARILATICSILTLAGGLSTAHADPTMSLNGTRIALSEIEEAFDGVLGLLYDNKKGLVGAGGDALVLVINGFTFESAGAFEGYTGWQLPIKSCLIPNRGDYAVLESGSFCLLGVRGDDLDPVPVVMGFYESVSAIASPLAGKDKFLVEVGRRQAIEGFFFDIDDVAEVGVRVEEQRFNIGVSFNF